MTIFLVFAMHIITKIPSVLHGNYFVNALYTVCEIFGD